MKHHDKYKDLDIKQMLQKVREFQGNLVSQQTMLTKAKSQSEAAAKAGFICGGRDCKISPAL